MWRSEDSWHCHMHGRVDVNSVIHIMGLEVWMQYVAGTNAHRCT